MPRYSVESGVKIPARRRGRPSKYPFAKMARGDSFKFSTIKRKRVTQASKQYADRHGCKFAIRSNGVEARIWRVK